MREWWQNLSEREKVLLLGGGTFFIAIIFYLFLWQPFLDQLSIKRQDVIEQTQLLSWMEKVVPKLKRVQQTNPTQVEKINAADLLSSLDQSLQKSNLKMFVTDFNQTDSDKVAIKFQKVPFDKLIHWTTEIWQKNAIQIVQMNITPEQAKGTVTAEMVVSVS